MNTKVQKIFDQKFGGKGLLYAAPGRINLIGEHTDYNDGFVLPGAIDMGIVAAIKPNYSNVVKAYAIDLDEYAEFTIGQSELPEQSWMRYIYGVSLRLLNEVIRLRDLRLRSRVIFHRVVVSLRQRSRVCFWICN